MRKTWKEVGLGCLNLLLLVIIIILVQLPLRKHGAPLLGAAILAVLCFVAYVAGVKWIERRSPTELTAGRTLPEGAAGLLVGCVLFSAVMAILWVAGVYHPAGKGAADQLVKGFVLAVLAGIVEEILFRGLLFRLSAKIVGTWGALLLTAALFGAAHAANPGATLGSSLAIALEAGILLGAAYAATTRLWLPIGLHIGWNFTEGSLFGMSISGDTAHNGVIQGTLSGPVILTGGKFGPEASIVAVLVCLVAALFLLRRMIKLGLIQPPVWAVRRMPSN
ncbi:MAG: CPBP family intramembrane glutamic endopeptidase [Candidatus Korobacteraceae bacterium]